MDECTPCPRLQPSQLSPSSLLMFTGYAAGPCGHLFSLLCYRKHQNLATVTDKAKPLRTGKFQLKHDSSIWMHTLRTWLVLLSTRHVEQTFYFSAPQGNWLIDGVPSHSFKPGAFGEDIPFPIQALSRRYIQPSSALPINGPKNKNHKGKQGQFPIPTLIF